MIILLKQQLNQIAELIRDYSGIILERVTSRDITPYIEEHMKKIGVLRFEDYLCALKYGSDYKPTLSDLISRLTVSESFFFRNPGQFEYLYEEYFPHLYKTRGKGKAIRIWSAGCAQGEEAYSLAMVAKRFQLEHPGTSFHIYAGDINKENLAIAREGIYNKRSLRNRVEKFEELLNLRLGRRDEKGKCKVADEIANLVQFRRLNLKQRHERSLMAGSNIIFCRNVLIYFSEDFRRELIRNLADRLVPGGLLCLGESECLPKDVDCFEVISYRNSYCYRKPETGRYK
jgi:chemotaxis protein methyltransferase CheR